MTIPIEQPITVRIQAFGGFAGSCSRSNIGVADTSPKHIQPPAQPQK